MAASEATAVLARTAQLAFSLFQPLSANRMDRLLPKRRVWAPTDEFGRFTPGTGKGHRGRK